MSLVPDKLYKEVVTDFLGSAPSLKEIAAYRIPDELRLRANQLVDKSRTDNLTDAERIELREYKQIDHILTLVKAKATLNLKAQLEQENDNERKLTFSPALIYDTLNPDDQQ